MSSDKNSEPMIGLQCPADWHLFDWYNGRLTPDEKCITRNVSAATATDVLKGELAGLGSKIERENLSVVERLDAVLILLK